MISIIFGLRMCLQFHCTLFVYYFNLNPPPPSLQEGEIGIQRVNWPAQVSTPGRA